MLKVAGQHIDLSLERLVPRDQDSARPERPNSYALSKKERLLFVEAFNHCSKRMMRNADTIQALDQGQLTSVFVGLSLCLRNGYMPIRIAKFGDIKKQELKDDILKWDTKKGRVHAAAISFKRENGDSVLVYPNSKGWRVITSSQDMSGPAANFNSAQLTDNAVNKLFKEGLNAAKESLHVIPLGRLSNEPLSWFHIQSFLTLLALEILPTRPLEIVKLQLADLKSHVIDPNKSSDPANVAAQRANVPLDFHAVLKGPHTQVELHGNGPARNFAALVTRADNVFSRDEMAYIDMGFNILTPGTPQAGLSFHLRHAADLRSEQIRALVKLLDHNKDSSSHDTHIKISRRFMMVMDILKFVRGVVDIESEALAPNRLESLPA